MLQVLREFGIPMAVATILVVGVIMMPWALFTLAGKLDLKSAVAAQPPGCCIEVRDDAKAIRVIGVDCGNWRLALGGCK